MQHLFVAIQSRIVRVVLNIITSPSINFISSLFDEVGLEDFIVILSLLGNWICHLIFANVRIHCSFWSLVVIHYFFYVKVVEDNPSYWDLILSALAVGWQEIVVSGYRIFIWRSIPFTY